MARQLAAKDPEPAEIREWEGIRGTGEWRRLVAGLVKWMNVRQEVAMAGRNDVSAFEAWRLAVEKYFREWGVENRVLQAKLAVVTFRDNAERWWIAHLDERPALVVSYAQLIEWMRVELVPGALTSASYLAWSDLQYRGNLEAYLRKIESLFQLHPIDPLTAHVYACRPLSRRLVSKIAGMDHERGGAGISLPQLLFQIRCYAEEHETELRGPNLRPTTAARNARCAPHWKRRR